MYSAQAHRGKVAKQGTAASSGKKIEGLVIPNDALVKATCAEEDCPTGQVSSAAKAEIDTAIFHEFFQIGATLSSVQYRTERGTRPARHAEKLGAGEGFRQPQIPIPDQTHQAWVRYARQLRAFG
jgi:hypothetical protein